MTIKYRTVWTDTLKGLRLAETLHRNGWKQGRVGLFTIQFYKIIPRKVKHDIRLASTPKK